MMRGYMNMKKRGARLGQHFLVNAHFSQVLAQAVAVREGETILEIGPGKGALTKELLATGARVVAVEKDEALVDQLKKTFAREIATGKLSIVEGDVRQFDPSGLGPYVLAANIPYYITGEIIRQFLTDPHQPRAAALLIQKEVAERILARDKKESLLSVSVKIYGTPRIVAKVGKGNFSPPPSVDSAILLIEHISRDFLGDTKDEDFFKIARAGFSARRKMLGGNLANVFGKEESLRACTEAGIDPRARAEDLSLADWKRILSRMV